jgi:hypothetical protein
VDDETDQELLADAERPLADVAPVELVEVDEPGHEPPEDWYERVRLQTAQVGGDR